MLLLFMSNRTESTTVSKLTFEMVEKSIKINLTITNINLEKQVGSQT